MSIEPEQFIDVFQLAALQAGAVARRLQGRVWPQQKDGAASPEAEALSAVDLATQDVILLLLHRSLPEVAVDAEEETDSVSLFPESEPTRSLVVLDPVDGSLNYLRRSSDYAVMGSLLEQGHYRASLVHFPAYDETFWAIRDGGCWQQRTGVPPRRVHVGQLPHRVLLTPKTSGRWRDAVQHHGYEVDTSRCSGVDASAPAIGRAIGAIAGGHPDRRRAIGFLLTTEAGGTVRLGDHRWRGEDPAALPERYAPSITAASDAVAEELLEAIGRT